MNNSRTHYVEKLTIKNIINAKQSLIKLHRSSVTFCRADKNPYRQDGRADKDSYRHDRHAYSLSLHHKVGRSVVTHRGDPAGWRTGSRGKYRELVLEGNQGK